MALVSGRPISFRMDLYQPLYVPRPVVEPELFASLRPPTYEGNMAGQGGKAAHGPAPRGAVRGFQVIDLKRFIRRKRGSAKLKPASLGPRAR